jgi:hypothetical protein
MSELKNRFQNDTLKTVPNLGPVSMMQIADALGVPLADTPKKPAKTKKWQPIETAPKDGTWLLLLMSDSSVPVVGSFWGRWYYADDFELDNVTHWMPLPDPPA